MKSTSTQSRNYQKKSQLSQKIELANSLIHTPQRHKALGMLDTLLKDLDESDIGALRSIGVLALNLDQFSKAIELLSKVLATDPKNPAHLDLLAAAYIRNRRYIEAKVLLEQALSIQPDFPSALVNMGCIHIDNKNYHAAIDVLERAFSKTPSDVILLINLSAACSAIGKHEDALRHIKRAIKLDPLSQTSYRTMGMLQLYLGQPEEAIKSFRKGIAIKKTFGGCYYGIASSKKFTEDDRDFIREIESVLTLSMHPGDEELIHFALGKIYDDLKEWDSAFKHYRQGNLLRKDAFYKPSPKKLVKLIRKSTTPRLTQLESSFGSDSDIPVFIFGMPRTGSTLIEQIISSHPDASSAGEMIVFNRMVDEIYCPLNKPFSEVMAALSTDSLHKQAEQYLAVLKSGGRQDSSRIIDKSPANFHYLGLILMLFPNARLIHTIRHPLDTLLSCYFQPFDEIYWATDLGWLAKTYSFYRDNMRYWEKVLPPGRIINVHYEELIADPETQSKRVMDACGLEWQPACLDFFKKEGNVRTSSAWQVRQPIYHTSKMRWVSYAKHLDELANGIKPYLTESDIEVLRQHGITIRRPFSFLRGWQNLKAQ